ncbi:MAG: hypothetical protein ACFE9C_00180 [Candidatus Hodarchaeota archaeon]
MKETKNNKDTKLLIDKNLPTIFLFWLKIFFGIIGGITHYFIQRILFYIGSFNVHYLLRGLFINTVIFAYISFIHVLMTLIILFLRKKFPTLVPDKENVWRFTLRFSFVFIVIFIISASITFYIGF